MSGSTSIILNEKHRKKVLVVDDTAFFRALLSDLIREEGHEVFTAEDGDQALTFLKERGSELDLILLDINMPRVNGFKVLHTIQQWNLKKNGLPHILVITGEVAGAFEVKAARNMGADGFITKTDPPDYTLSRIRRELFSWEEKSEGP